MTATSVSVCSHLPEDCALPRALPVKPELPRLLPPGQGVTADGGRWQHVGQDVAVGGWDGALEVNSHLAPRYCWVVNLVGLDETLQTELEI